MNAVNAIKWTPIHSAAQNGKFINDFISVIDMCDRLQFIQLTHLLKILTFRHAFSSKNVLISFYNINICVQNCSGHDKAVQVLAENGADINVINSVNGSPLHVAGNEKVIEALVRNGANVNAKNKEGQSALDIARNRGKFLI